MPDQPRNTQSGAPAAESTGGDKPIVARAERRLDAHYEADPAQLVKVAHLVGADELARDTPTDAPDRDGPEPAEIADVRVSPAEASVWEASADEDREDPA